MNYRSLGRTGWKVSEISFGAWAIGGFWGEVDDKESMAALHMAVDCGVNFIDTADVYGMGRSERLCGQLKRERKEEVIIATKAGRKLPQQTVEGYSKANLTAWLDESLRNLGVECIDLLQLHCPPADLYNNPEAFGLMDEFARAGKIRHYGVSVERIDEALKAIEYPNVQSVQIIFNIFRQRPARLLFEEAKKRQVGILARVPLASGLLTGRITKDTQFAADDHRNFNRQGEMFDVGETFSGVDVKVALAAVEKLKVLLGRDMTLAQFALRWILMFDAVSCAIPGGKRPSQVKENCGSSGFEALAPEVMERVASIYESNIAPLVDQRW